MTEAVSATTFMLEAGLPWPEDAADVQQSGPFDGAVVYGSGFRKDCSIRKISALGATLCGDLSGRPGEQLAVELATGQRPAGTIAWASLGEIGIGFDQPIDVIALINRKLVSQPIERRQMPRVEIRCSAWVKSGQDFAAATIRNISAGGLQLEGDALPPVGNYVAVFVEGLNIPPGEIVWKQSNTAGVELLHELSWTSIMPWVRDLVRREPQ